MHTAYFDKPPSAGRCVELDLQLLNGTRPRLFCEQTVSKIGFAHTIPTTPTRLDTIRKLNGMRTRNQRSRPIPGNLEKAYCIRFPAHRRSNRSRPIPGGFDRSVTNL